MDSDVREDGNREDADDRAIQGGEDSGYVRHPRSKVGQSQPRLGSRVLLTWLELTVVGITGGILGATVGGPPGFIVYLATSLITVGIIFYNVNELIKGWMGVTGADEGKDA